MKLPRRLPFHLQALLEIETAYGRLKLVSESMRRSKGAAHIELTYIDDSETLVTMDALLFYNKYERRWEEHSSSHRRKLDTLRKAVLAS